jgi:hypothetical protein
MNPVTKMANKSSTQDESVAPEDLSKMLGRSWDTVYQTSPDGESYISPQCLNGTPVHKITEKGEYWKIGWNSLDAYLAQEKAEEELKADARQRYTLTLGSKTAKDALKLHTDNVSKHRRIRDIFGPDSSYHPNQLVSKHQLPPEGLCQKELMYRMACKVADLRILHQKGELAMDPWDLFRWRVSLKLRSCMDFAAQSGRDYIRTIAYKLCEDSGLHSSSKKYEDSLLRKAILRSADYQHRASSFGKPGGPKKIGNGSKVSRAKVEPLSSSSSIPAMVAARVEKRQKKASQPSTYQGVNAYRAQQADKQLSRNGDSKL